MPNLRKEQQSGAEEKSRTVAANKQSARSPSSVHRQSEPGQKNNKGSVRLRERLKDCIPNDPRSCLFALVSLVYLIIGVIHFCLTGDTTMLTTLLASVGAYVGLPEVKALVSKGKNGRYES